jgi:hypothetical protein
MLSCFAAPIDALESLATSYFEPVGYMSIGGILGEKLHAISENACPEVLLAYAPSIGVVGAQVQILSLRLIRTSSSQQFQIQKSMIAKCRWRLKSRRHKQNRPAPVKASIESTKVDFACIAAVSTAKLEC